MSATFALQDLQESEQEAGGGAPFPRAPTLQPGTPSVPSTAKTAQEPSPRGVAEVQPRRRRPPPAKHEKQPSRPNPRRADRYADDVLSEDEDDVEEDTASNPSYYDEKDEARSSASSDNNYRRTNRRRRSLTSNSSSDNDESTLQDDDDDGDDDESVDSYVDGAALATAGTIMQNVFGAFKGDDNNAGEGISDDDDEEDTVDGDASTASSHDRKIFKMCYKLSSNDHRVTEIDVDCSALQRETARALADILPHNTRLERARLAAPSTSSSSSDKKTALANFRILVGGLATNTSVTDLQIRNTLLTREAAGQLGRALSSNASIRKLCLRNCQFADDSALPVLFCGMQHARSIRELYILQCDLSDPVNADVVSATVPLLKLQSLCLIDARLTLDGLRFLADNVERTPSLTQINLSINRTVGTPEGIGLLADVLESGKLVNLTSLSVSSCSLGPDGADELAKSLVDNTTLTSLNLSGNRFGDEGAIHLRYLLERNQTIKELSFDGCDITKRRQKALHDGLKYNNSLLKSLFSKETSLSIFNAVDRTASFSKELGTSALEIGNVVTDVAKESVELARRGR